MTKKLTNSTNFDSNNHTKLHSTYKITKYSYQSIEYEQYRKNDRIKTSIDELLTQIINSIEWNQNVYENQSKLNNSTILDIEYL